MEKLRKVWDTELEILHEVDRICKKNNIRYFACSGTLLGAIRHGGFIPWDDDIDLVMFREDYNKFRKIAEREMSEKFFCQSGYNDKGFFGGLLHIRKNGTTAILRKMYPKAKYHQGIFIDIFPLDGVIENKMLFKIQTQLKKGLNAVMWYKNYYKSIPTSFKQIFLMLPSFLPQKFLFFMFENICSLKKVKKSKYVDTVSYFGMSGKRLKKCYDKVKMCPFDKMILPIPNDYGQVLESLYGSDYMVPKQVQTDHGDVFFDTENSYEDYLIGKKELPTEFVRENL